MWRKFRALPMWVQVAAWVGLVLVIAAIGGAGDEEGDETVQAVREQPAATAVAPEPTEPTTAATAAPTTARPTTSTTVAGPKTSFGAGTHRVGTDIAPGTYTAPGGTSCYWARLSGFGGSLGEIIANNIGAGQQVVTILASDAGFDNRGCGTWTRG